jgi:hypothetical protein
MNRMEDRGSESAFSNPNSAFSLASLRAFRISVVNNPG